MNITAYRPLFPITKTDIYLNHAAVSPLSTRVTEAMNGFLQRRVFGPVDQFAHVFETRTNLKTNIARLIKTQPGNIAVISNTSEGFNWLVNGLTWQRGERILLVQDEFPSNIYPFLNLQRLGVEIDFVQTRDGAIYPEDIESKIQDRTRLFSISFVEFLNGFRNDLAAIGSICRRSGIIFSVDGIQGIGALPVDVEAMQIDFVSNGGHKWLMAPLGCGFMYIAPHLHAQLHPAYAGWLSVKDSWNFLDYKLDFIEDAGRYEIATPNAVGIVGAEAASGLLVEVGPENIEKHLFYLGSVLIEGMAESGFRYIGSEDHKNRSGIFSFLHEKNEAIFNYLQGHKVHISLRENVLRIAPHFYNNVEEIKQFIQLCRNCIP